MGVDHRRRRRGKTSPADAQRPGANSPSFDDTFHEGSKESLTGPRRLHGAFVAVQVIQSIVVVAIAAICVILSSEFDDAADEFSEMIAGWCVGCCVLAAVLVIVYSYLFYRRFRWEMTTTHLLVSSGILIKKKTQVPYGRIQTVNVTAGILHRLFGIATVAVDTAGGTNNKIVTIHALALADAEELRARLFALRSHAGSIFEQTSPADDTTTGARESSASVFGASGVFGGESAGVEEIVDGMAGFRGLYASSYDEVTEIEHSYRLSSKEILLACVASFDLKALAVVVVGVASLLLVVLTLIVGQDASTVPMWTVTLLSNIGVILVIAISVAVALACWVITIAGSFLILGGFTAVRRGGRIEVTSGLISRRSKSVAIERVQSVRIVQNILMRLMGYARIEIRTVDSAAGESSSNGSASIQTPGVRLHPLVRLEEAQEVVTSMVGELSDRPAEHEMSGLPLVARRRSVVRRSVIPGLCCAAVFAVVLLAIDSSTTVTTGMNQVLAVFFTVVTVCVFAVGAISGLWAYKRAAYGHTAQILALRSGTFGMVLEYVSRSKAQWLSCVTNPLQRWHGICTFKVATAAGIQGTKLRLRDVEHEIGMDLVEWMRPHDTRLDSEVG